MPKFMLYNEVYLKKTKGDHMKIYALVGKSGTGKSYRAMTLASSRDIEFIVDDGLLIHGSKRLGGKSAKREKTIIAAVKRALFFDEEHREEIKAMIAERKPKSVLIIGTSDRMVRKIGKALGFEKIDEIIYIDEIATEEEIEIAREERMKFGKHVIPVPNLELKRDFSGYFLDTFNVLLKRRGKGAEMAEKTVMRPSFSYMGKYSIANKALVQIITYVTQSVEGVLKVNRIKITKYRQGVAIDIDLTLNYGVQVVKVCEKIQTQVKEDMEKMTRINVLKLNVHVKAVRYQS